MIKFVLRLWRVEGQVVRPSGDPVPPGSYLKSFNVEAHDGQGTADFTDDPNEALHFDSFSEAMDAWMRQSKTRPLRADGRPNRPLTAFTMLTDTIKLGSRS